MNNNVRKCYKCNKDIQFDINDVKDIIYYKKKYYHKNCFETMALEKSQNNRCNKEEWQHALDNIEELELEAKSIILNNTPRDQLNDWILDHYDVIEINSNRYFWQSINELSKGIYRKKRCKAISINDLLSAWKWAQNNLDKININNKKNNRGPKNDNERLLYDLAIVVRKYPEYLKYKSKMQAIEASTTHETEKIEINYSNLERKTEKNKFDDISSLLDEIF